MKMVERTFGALDEGDLLGEEALVASGDEVEPDGVGRGQGLGDYHDHLHSVLHRAAGGLHLPPANGRARHGGRQAELRVRVECRMARAAARIPGRPLALQPHTDG